MRTKRGLHMRGRVSGATNRIGHLAQRRRDRIEMGVYRHPMQSVLVTLSAGLLIGLTLGLLVGRRRVVQDEILEEEEIGA